MPPAATEPAALADLLDQAQRVAEARAMCDEPECVDSRAIAHWAEIGAFRHAQQHEAEVRAMRELRPLLRAEDRLRDAERRAKQAKRRDMKGELLALRGMLTREQRRGIEPAPGSALIVSLERAEASLDGVDLAA